MDTNEIMANEEVIETTEELVKAGSGKGFKVAAGIGIAVLAGVLAWQYVAKPVIAKIKAQKEQREMIAPAFEAAECYEAESEDDSE